MSRAYSNYADIIDFTRASSGTALRRVKYGAELVTNGTFDSDSDWVLSGDATISGGKATLSAQYAVIQQNISITNGQLVRISYQVVSNTDEANPNLALSSSGFTNSTTFINNDVGNHTIDVVVEDATKPLRFVLALATTIVIDNVSVKEVTFDTSDGDLILFNHPNNIPRIEYDANGNLLGLLVEESRTNLVTYSDDFTDSSWVATNFSTSGALPVVTANQAVAPDGTARADKIVFDTVDASGISALYHNVTAFNGQGCYSIWLKSNSGNVTLRLRIDYSGSSAAKNITVTESWQRFDLTTASGLTGIYQVSLRLRPSLGTDATGTIYAYNAQLEAGSFPTSAIPTSGSTATRSADVASLSTSAFGYNQDESSFVWEGKFLSTVAETEYLYNFNDGTSGIDVNNSIRSFKFTDGNLLHRVTTNNVAQVNSNSGSVSEGLFKSGFAIKENSQVSSTNGVNTAEDTSVLVPSITTLHIAPSFYGHIKSLKYYPRRLTNAQLQALTS